MPYPTWLHDSLKMALCLQRGKKIIFVSPEWACANCRSPSSLGRDVTKSLREDQNEGTLGASMKDAGLHDLPDAHRACKRTQHPYLATWHCSLSDL